MNQAGYLGGIEQIIPATFRAVYNLELDATAWARNSIDRTLGYELFDSSTNAIISSGSFTDTVGGTWTTLSLQGIALSSLIGVRIEGIKATQAGMGRQC